MRCPRFLDSECKCTEQDLCSVLDVTDSNLCYPLIPISDTKEYYHHSGTVGWLWLGKLSLCTATLLVAETAILANVGVVRLCCGA